MGAKRIADDIARRLNSEGIHLPISVIDGGWNRPSVLKVGDRELPFWDDVGVGEKEIAKALLNDTYRAIGRPDRVVE